jgi:hypothetical protein
VGVTAVLTGGGAAAFYAPRAIQSFDLDFVLTVYTSEGGPAEVLSGLGYRRVGHDYVHAESPFPLEFPPGPLAIGDDLVERWETVRERGNLLHVLSSTDSCRDRLAAFYHFGDRSSLVQAQAVCEARRAEVSLALIERWSRREGHLERFREFRELVDPDR